MEKVLQVGPMSGLPIKKVLIGIQARSTSSRLPGKSQMMIGKKPIIQHVIDACKSSTRFLNNCKHDDISVKVALLVPDGDPLIEMYRHENDLVIYTGSEADVLSRYEKAFNAEDPDYLCRITGDCPFIADHIITKHIVAAVRDQLDSMSNCHPEYRTEADGSDCEVLSKKLFYHLCENAKGAYQREHVTVYFAQEGYPFWARKGLLHVKSFDRSNQKHSIDDEKDLVRMNDLYVSRNEKIRKTIVAGFKVYFQ